MQRFAAKRFYGTIVSKAHTSSATVSQEKFTTPVLPEIQEQEQPEQVNIKIFYPHFTSKNKPVFFNQSKSIPLQQVVEYNSRILDLFAKQKIPDALPLVIQNLQNQVNIFSIQKVFAELYYFLEKQLNNANTFKKEYLEYMVKLLQLVHKNYTSVVEQSHVGKGIEFCMKHKEYSLGISLFDAIYMQQETTELQTTKEDEKEDLKSLDPFQKHSFVESKSKNPAAELLIPSIYEIHYVLSHLFKLKENSHFSSIFNQFAPLLAKPEILENNSVNINLIAMIYSMAMTVFAIQGDITSIDKIMQPWLRDVNPRHQKIVSTVFSNSHVVYQYLKAHFLKQKHEMIPSLFRLFCHSSLEFKRTQPILKEPFLLIFVLYWRVIVLLQEKYKNSPEKLDQFLTPREKKPIHEIVHDNLKNFPHLKLDTAALDTISAALLETKNYVQALDFFAKYEQDFKIKHSAISYTMMLQSLVRLQATSYAEKLFEQLMSSTDTSVWKNSHTFTIMLKCYLDSNNLEKGISLFHYIITDGTVTINQPLFNLYVCLVGKSKNNAKLMSQIPLLMKQYQIIPDDKALQLLFKNFIHSNLVDEAIFVLKEMKKRNISADEKDELVFIQKLLAFGYSEEQVQNLLSSSKSFVDLRKKRSSISTEAKWIEKMEASFETEDLRNYEYIMTHLIKKQEYGSILQLWSYLMENKLDVLNHLIGTEEIQKNSFNEIVQLGIAAAMKAKSVTHPISQVIYELGRVSESIPSFVPDLQLLHKLMKSILKQYKELRQMSLDQGELSTHPVSLLERIIEYLEKYYQRVDIFGYYCLCYAQLELESENKNARLNRAIEIVQNMTAKIELQQQLKVQDPWANDETVEAMDKEHLQQVQQILVA